MLEVRAVLVAVPGELGQRAGPDLAGVVGEADDRQVVARVLRPDERVERDRDLLGRQEAAAQQHRAAHVDQQHRRGLRQLLGPVDLEVGRARGGPADHRVAARAAGAFSSRPRALNSVAAQVEVERVAELVRLGRLVALPSPPAAVDPVPAERVALEPREQVVEHLLADPAAAARRQLQALAVARQVARLLEPAGQVVERVEVAHGLVAEQVADLVAVDARRDRRAPRRRRARPRARSIACEPRDLGERALEPERLVAAERHPLAEPAGQQQVEVRGELGEVDHAAGRRAAARPSSTGARPAARASSSAGATASPPSAAASWSMMSSKVRAPGKNRAVLGEELGSVRVAAPDPLADELVEVADHLAVGREVLRRHRPDRLGHARRRTGRAPGRWSRSTSSSKRSRAPGSRKS